MERVSGELPNGFYADLARAYLKKLAESGVAAPPATAPSTVPAPAASTSAPARARTPRVELGANASLNGRAPLARRQPVAQGHLQGAGRSQLRHEILARIGLDKPLHPDFGTEWEGAPIGIPYVVVGGTQQKVPVTFTYADESDPGPYPIPPDAPIEGGPKGDGDRHVIVLDRDNWMLYELFNAFPDGKGGWKAGCGAIWDLKKNQCGPPAGPPPTPPACRSSPASCATTRSSAGRRSSTPSASRWPRRAAPTSRRPATGRASSHDDDLPPMGMRVRLKADFDISGFSPEAQVILQALKKYGMILADNGSDNFISGAPDPRWDLTSFGISCA